MSLAITGGPYTFVEVTEPQLDSGEVIAQALLQAINADVLVAVGMVEDFWGYYRVGETVGLPTSPLDGYTYKRSELLYAWEIFSTAAAPGALNGTQAAPAPGAPSGTGQILQMGFSIDQGSGVISGVAQYGPVGVAGEQGTYAYINPVGVFSVSYYATKGAQTNTQDGILLVRTLARRMAQNPIPGSATASLINGQVVVSTV